jgi:hypothetical protein
MDVKEAAALIYLNIYNLHKGDKELINERIKEVNEALNCVGHYMIDKIKVLSKSDLIANAISHSFLPLQLLSIKFEDVLKNHF